MYTPKTTSLGILIGGLIFCAFGLTIIDIPVLHTSYTSGEILTYSQSPQVRFSYNGIQYSPISGSSMSCNDRPCYSIGESVTILFDKRDPNRFMTLGEFLFSSLLPLIGFSIVIGWIYFYVISKKRRDVILSLQARGAFVDATIVDMEILKSHSRKGGSRVIGYKYKCKDTLTGELYDSDTISIPVFEVGSRVKVIKDDLQFPGIYWVDLNTVTADSADQHIAEEYQENLHSDIHEKIRKNIRTPISYRSMVIFCGVLVVFFILLAYVIKSIVLSMIALICIGFFIYNIHFLLREKKSQSIREKNIQAIVQITGIEKVGNSKSILLGYVPENEKEILKIEGINDQNGLSLKNMYGYRYYFYVNVAGVQKKTEIFSKPFPEKCKEGARVRLYFDDIGQQGDFFIDLESISELN